MIAAPMCDGNIRITTDHPAEIPYLDMTIKWLKEAGIQVTYDEKEHKFFEIKGNQKYKAFDKYMPSDWSSVAFPTVAALTPAPTSPSATWISRTAKGTQW